MGSMYMVPCECQMTIATSSFFHPHPPNKKPSPSSSMPSNPSFHFFLLFSFFFFLHGFAISVMLFAASATATAGALLSLLLAFFFALLGGGFLPGEAVFALPGLQPCRRSSTTAVCFLPSFSSPLICLFIYFGFGIGSIWWKLASFLLFMCVLIVFCCWLVGVWIIVVLIFFFFFCIECLFWWVRLLDVACMWSFLWSSCFDFVFLFAFSTKVWIFWANLGRWALNLVDL